MKTFVVNKSGERHPVRVVHWWPGRVYVDPERTAAFSRMFKDRRYGTVATVTIWELPGRFGGMSRCGKSDVPSRKRGRQIALGRLVKRLNDAASPYDGWHLDEEGNR